MCDVGSAIFVFETLPLEPYAVRFNALNALWSTVFLVQLHWILLRCTGSNLSTSMPRTTGKTHQTTP